MDLRLPLNNRACGLEGGPEETEGKLGSAGYAYLLTTGSQ